MATHGLPRQRREVGAGRKQATSECSSPPASNWRSAAVVPERRGERAVGEAFAQHPAVEVDGDPAGPGHPVEVGDEAVGDVDERGGPGVGGDRPGRDRRARREVGRTSGSSPGSAPASSRASPAPERPRVPQTATTSPTPAPDRSTAGARAGRPAR